jgi:signal transduction histidine kinase
MIGGRTMAVTARPLREGGAVLALFDTTPLRKLEAMRRDFVANVSHELRTPLTVVGGFAETLVGCYPPESQEHRFAESIHANALRMQRIVDDLLDLSRIESGGWIPAQQETDVAALGGEMLGSYREVARTKGITLTLDVPPELRAHVDPTALRQVLGNLVNNAVRHTQAGSVTIFARRETDGGTAIGVGDTGVGIAPEHLPRIFERFYRVDPGRSRAEGGTGLGLSIVRHLVEAHGGHVTAESVAGRGTTITAVFPPAPTEG